MSTCSTIGNVEGWKESIEHSDEATKKASEESSDLVKVVNRVSLIENLINQIIQSFIGPREHASLFVWNVLLDTSILSLGAKLKLALTISQEVQYKLDKNSLHEVINLRNAFAHNATNSHQVIEFGAKGIGGTAYTELWILGSSGTHKILKRHEAFDTFNKNYSLAKASLKGLIEAVKKQLEEHAVYAAEKNKASDTNRPAA